MSQNAKKVFEMYPPSDAFELEQMLERIGEWLKKYAITAGDTIIVEIINKD
jgi:flagellar biosynthesis/type III secretory pathway ATPase